MLTITTLLRKRSSSFEMHAAVGVGKAESEAVGGVLRERMRGGIGRRRDLAFARVLLADGGHRRALVLQDGERSIRFERQLEERRPLPGKVAQDELAVLVAPGQRAGVAIDAQDGSRYVGPGLVNDEPPRRFALRALHRDDPDPADRRCLRGRRLRRRRTAGAERIGRAARTHVLAFEPPVNQPRLDACRVVIEGERQRVVDECPAGRLNPFVAVEERSADA